MNAMQIRNSIKVMLFGATALVALFAVLPVLNKVMAGTAPAIKFISYDGGQGFAYYFDGGSSTVSGSPELYLVVVQDGNYLFDAFEYVDGNDLLGGLMGGATSGIGADVVVLPKVGAGEIEFRAIYCFLDVGTANCRLSDAQKSGSQPLPEESHNEIKNISFTFGESSCSGTGCFGINRSTTFFSESQMLLIGVTKSEEATGCGDNFSVHLVGEGVDEVYSANRAKKDSERCIMEFDEDSDLVELLKSKADSSASGDFSATLFPYYNYADFSGTIRAKIFVDGNVKICYDESSGGSVGNLCDDDADDDVDDDPADLPAFDADSTCKNLTKEADQENCRECFAKNETGDSSSAFVWSEIGCIDTSQNGFTVRIFQIGFGLYGGIVMVKVGMAALAMQDRDPAKIKEFKEVINAAVWALAALAGAIPILQFLGINVLGIFPSNFFT